MKLKQKLAIRYLRAQLNILSLVSTRKAAIKAFRYFCTPRQHRTGKYPAIFERSERVSFKLHGRSIRGYRWLPDAGNAGETTKKVLIAHGFESWSGIFDGYIGALLKKGYEVIAFDAPAHGRTGGRRIQLNEYIDMLQSIQQNFGPFQAWLGHSLGGLALVLALEDMALDGGARLALIAPAVETTAAVDAFGDLLHLSGEVLGEMNNYVEEKSGHPFAWYSLRRAIGQVKADILYVQDEEDRVTLLKDALLVKQDGHDHIQFVFTTGLGHRKICKDRELMDRIVDFL
jgi:pimeloyl-ACP methyl ester carboxylesterase